MIPGEVFFEEGEIEINTDRKTVKIEVINTGDRPVQVGSHYHFSEANNMLEFDREKVKGMRLNILSGTAIRFEPGQKRTVELVEFSGKREIYGFQGKVMGAL